MIDCVFSWRIMNLFTRGISSTFLWWMNGWLCFCLESHERVHKGKNLYVPLMDEWLVVFLAGESWTCSQVEEPLRSFDGWMVGCVFFGWRVMNVFTSGRTSTLLWLWLIKWWLIDGLCLWWEWIIDCVLAWESWTCPRGGEALQLWQVLHQLWDRYKAHKEHF